jgi:hypothetical protein
MKNSQNIPEEPEKLPEHPGRTIFQRLLKVDTGIRLCRIVVVVGHILYISSIGGLKKI